MDFSTREVTRACQASTEYPKYVQDSQNTKKQLLLAQLGKQSFEGHKTLQIRGPEAFETLQDDARKRS